MHICIDIEESCMYGRASLKRFAHYRSRLYVFHRKEIGKWKKKEIIKS